MKTSRSGKFNQKHEKEKEAFWKKQDKWTFTKKKPWHLILLWLDDPSFFGINLTTVSVYSYS